MILNLCINFKRFVSFLIEFLQFEIHKIIYDEIIPR